jgi:hypothetical protein
MHSTNYTNVFIEIADDCPIKEGEFPPIKGEKKSMANLQFEILQENPYKYTSDDVLYSVFAQRKEIPEGELAEQREVFFSKGQPCFRASPLTKRYGWGIHNDENGKIAIYGSESNEYQTFIANNSIKKVKAMSTKRK